MYINDIEENLNSTVPKFADDTKVMKVIDNHHCHADLLLWASSFIELLIYFYYNTSYFF